MDLDPSAIPSDGGPLVFVVDLELPVVDDDDHHHLARVRRVRDGDPVIVGDGAGRWRRCRWSGHRPEPVGEVVVAPAAQPPIGVAFALTKGAKPELAVQKLTELGVDRIVPFVAARSVVRWDAERADAALHRMRKVAREAAMQSRRAWLPEVEAVSTAAALAAEPGAVLAERGGGPLSRDVRLVLVGPEGGWDPGELELSAERVALADGVLRAETAAIVAGALLAALRSGSVAAAG